MELIRISETRWKLALTREDMREYRLEEDGLCGEDATTKRIFLQILEDLGIGRAEDLSHDNFFVRAYPSRDGGCELFVSRISAPHKTPGTTAAKAYLTDALPTADPTEKVRDPAARTARGTRTSLYRFSSPRDLRAARRYADAATTCRERREYLGEDGGYYLLLKENAGTDRDRRLLLLSEFGTPMPPMMEYYIGEHALPLAP